MTENFKQSFAIIRQWNSPNQAETMDGHLVEREKHLYFGEPFNRFVLCADYDTHFVYDDPEARKGTIGRWTPVCTCGSAAGVVGYNAYKQDASPSAGMVTGELVVCLIHAQTGLHANVENKITNVRN
jgi:hypothetical protein